MVSPFPGAVFGILSVAIGLHYSGYWTLPTDLRGLIAKDETENFNCRPFLPNIFTGNPPSDGHFSIAGASQQLGDFLSNRFSVGDIDSLSVAVVSADGMLFEGNYGVMRGNESQTSPPTTSDSMYRVASVSKLFNVLEGHILAEKGVLSWEDPVEKYIPGFTHNSGSLTSPGELLSSKKDPITLFQLATHMSGLGRDWPPGNVANWPRDLQGAGPPPTNGLPFPENAALFRSITENPLISPPFTWPIYSNAGTGLLGLALLEADRAARNATESMSYADLVKRDIFDPLGMNGSHFLTSEVNKHLVVVPSLAPEVADQDFLDAMNPAGGQFSSLRDSVTVVQNLLNPEHPKSLISKAAMDKWLRPIHSFEEDDWTEAGFIWEIVKAPDSNKRLRRIYWKLGAMAGYHAALAIHPGTSYGVVVLLGGHFPDAAALAYHVFEIFQPAIDQALADASVARYAGEWFSQDRNSSASIAVARGTLYIDRLIADNVDILANFNPSSRVALRWMHEHEEFRLDIGLPYYNGKKHMGCYSYWAGMDVWGMRNGAALNAIFFSGNELDRRLHVPAVGIEMVRA
ncbi:beta-lactamase/transpeptidase-like protein [Mycena rosella]|uniref:Beta-lactamase/transpeptidase-like protein n=1 Tax=Mycena rosella TaxID=1033263 RepID=A0AAD7FXB1_MYCRO|nr:beta-lactamase/transpeptidase-like protein [Mycena rosella]